MINEEWLAESSISNLCELFTRTNWGTVDGLASQVSNHMMSGLFPLGLNDRFINSLQEGSSLKKKHDSINCIKAELNIQEPFVVELCISQGFFFFFCLLLIRLLLLLFVTDESCFFYSKWNSNIFFLNTFTMVWNLSCLVNCHDFKYKSV